MTAFKEIPIGNYVLRFWPSDNGWMCGITPSMMEALEQQATPPQRTWVGLTDEELSQIEGTHIGRSFAKAIEAKLRSKNESKN